MAETKAIQTVAYSDYWAAQADAVSSLTQLDQQEIAACEWDDYKYGLCALCAKGIDDKSDLVVDENEEGEMVMLCWDCGNI